MNGKDKGKTMKLKYKNYKLDYDYDSNEEIYSGLIKGHEDYVVCGTTKSEIESDFHYIVNNYLENDYN